MANKSRETTFRFKRFSVANRKSAMKVGTDGVLLGAWCAIPECTNQESDPAELLCAIPGSPNQDSDSAEWCAIPEYSCRIIDAGCGTGIIALMVAQRNAQACVTGIEIDADAASEAAENVSASPFSTRIKVVNGDFREFESDERFDLIVCNPPFFTESTKSPDEARANARTEGTLSVKSFLQKSVELLTEEGSVAFIAPAVRNSEILFDAALIGLHPYRQCLVITVSGKSPQRTLWQFTRKAKATELTTITIYKEPGVYSEQYINLVKDFYLNF